MFYARACNSIGEDICGGDNLLPLDGRYSLRSMRSLAAQFARKKGAAGYNIYANLQDEKPVIQLVFIKNGRNY